MSVKFLQFQIGHIQEPHTEELESGIKQSLRRKQVLGDVEMVEQDHSSKDGLESKVIRSPTRGIRVRRPRGVSSAPELTTASTVSKNTIQMMWLAGYSEEIICATNE